MLSRILLTALASALALPFSSDTRGVFSAPQTGTLQPVASMSKARADHTSTLLRDGRVLITEGMVENGVFLREAEAFIPATQLFSPLPKMALPRVGHTATLLADGTVLIAGGLQGENSAVDSEIFDSRTNTFHPGPKLRTARYGQSAVLLHSGSVLILGGESVGETPLADTEIFDPRSRNFTSSEPMKTARTAAAAALLQNGDVLVCGGMNAQHEILATCERFDAKHSHWHESGSLNLPRIKHDMVTLADGRVLVVGGANSNDWLHQHDTAEIIDAATQRSVATIKMNHKRFKLPETSVLLANGRVLVSGGSEYLELFDPRTRTFANVAPALAHPIYYARATLLKDGEVLITGGYGNGNRANGPLSGDRAWVYKP